jgi:hypothetical protein
MPILLPRFFSSILATSSCNTLFNKEHPSCVGKYLGKRDVVSLNLVPCSTVNVFHQRIFSDRASLVNTEGLSVSPSVPVDDISKRIQSEGT